VSEGTRTPDPLSHSQIIYKPKRLIPRIKSFLPEDYLYPMDRNASFARNSRSKFTHGYCTQSRES